MNIGIVFPGQGSQRVGMAEDFYEEYEITRNVFDMASEAIQVDLMKLCFEENDEINLTENTQPALLTVEIGIYNVLREKYNLSGDYFAGHSLGEYSALVASGALLFQDAVKIVRKRGSLMQHATISEPSGMVALICEDIENTDYQKIVAEEQIQIANVNSKDQVVLSGLKLGIDKVTERINRDIPEINIIELNVQTPFHSNFMKSIEADFESYLSDFSNRFNYANTTKVLSNFTGQFYSGTDLSKNLVRQLSGSVKWTINMQEILKRCDSTYEVGPNRVLGKFFATLGVNVKTIINLRSLKKHMDGK